MAAMWSDTEGKYLSFYVEILLFIHRKVQKVHRMFIFPMKVMKCNIRKGSRDLPAAKKRLKARAPKCICFVFKPDETFVA